MNLKYSTVGSTLTMLLLFQTFNSIAHKNINIVGETGLEFSNIDSTALKLDPNVRRGRLPNGLTYYIRHNKTKIGNADFMLVNKVGSVNEKDHERGLAHFVEHMAFNGTKHFEKNTLIDYLQELGVRFGADLNAYTGFDETVYLFPLPTQNRQVTDKGLQILRDWAGDISFDGKEIDQERGVILEEKRASNDVGRRKLAKLLPIMTNKSIYASRIPIGTEEVLKSFNRQDIINFYETWYRPDRQAIIVVGDIDVDQIERAIKSKFSDLKVKTNNHTPEKDAIKLGNGTQYLLVTDPEITESSFQLSIKKKGQIRNTVSSYRYAIMETLLSSMFTNRFMDLSRKNDAPYKMIMVGYGDAIGGLKATNLSIQPKAGLIEEAIISGYREVLRVKKFGFTLEELKQAQKQLHAYYDRQVGEKNKIASGIYVEKYKAEFLNGTSAMDILEERQLCRHLIEGISLEELNTELKLWLKEDDRDLLLFADEQEKKIMPDQPTLLGWMKNTERENLSAYISSPNITQFMHSGGIKPGHIVSRTENSKQGTTLLTLSNGAKVILKPTDFKDDEVIITAVSQGGASLVPDHDYQNVIHSAYMHSISGVGEIPPSALMKMLLTKNLRVGPYISEYEEGIQGISGKADVENALQLMHLYFTQPRMDEESYKKALDAIRIATKDRYKVSANVFSDSLSVLLTNNHFRRKPMTEADIEELDRDKMIDLYKERFGDAGDFYFFVVGSFKVDSISPLIVKYLGSLPSKEKKETFKDLKIDWHQGKLKKEIYAGGEDKATVVLYLGANFDNAPASRLQLQLLENALQNKLVTRLREKESGVYTPSAKINLTAVPHARYTIQINFVCAPANVEHLINATHEEIEKLQHEQTSLAILSKFKSERSVLSKQNQRNNSYWFSTLKNQYVYNEQTPDYDAEQKQLDQLTIQDIQQAAQKYIRLEQLSQFILLPKRNKI